MAAPHKNNNNNNNARPFNPFTHTRQGSSTTAVQPSQAQAMMYESNLSHRPSASLDRTRASHPNPTIVTTHMSSFESSSPSSGSRSSGGSLSGGIGSPSSPSSTNNHRYLSGAQMGAYSNLSMPSSPTAIGLGVHNANFPANYSSAYGQRGVKHSGVVGLSRHMDDTASVSSLILDRNSGGNYNTGYAQSYEGHSDDGDHTSFSSHSPYSAGLGGTAAAQRGLRQKTSFTHLKDSDHKILSNEEKYNAYVIPGVAHYDGPEADDALHDPGPRLKAVGPDRRLVDSRAIYGTTSLTSWRGWLNAVGISVIIIALVTFFAGYPLATYISTNLLASKSLYTNSTGQVPDIQNFRGLVDRDTPQEVYTKTGADGLQYDLVFSDEFNTPGRTFYDGDDPYWTAIDMHYYSTGDLEYYDPQQAYTRDGYLYLNLTKADPRSNHNLSYMSGMLQGWNQFCFTGGIIEASVSLPGDPKTTGLWPAFWTMGNLGRAGYGSSLEGTWPYSYDSCDTGTLPNQTDFRKQSGAWNTSWNAPLSYLPGQKLSACTCKGEDHPGPSHSVGRAAPELDVFETIVNPLEHYGEASQTIQVAPFDADYLWHNTTDTSSLGTDWDTEFNAYHGGVFQQSVSGLARTDQQSYYLVDKERFQTFSVQYKPSEGTDYDGYVYWVQGDKIGWSLKEAGLTGNKTMDYSQRLVPREPMYMIMNLGMADSFNPVDLKHLTFPAIMRFDWIRVYQRPDAINIGCDPKAFPTQDYINRHLNSYTNYNLTLWSEAEPKGFPKNSILDKC